MADVQQSAYQHVMRACCRRSLAPSNAGLSVEQESTSGKKETTYAEADVVLQRVELN